MTGYDQVFHRFFTKWDNLFAMLATMGLATSVPAIIFTVIIYAGGPGAALMNWIVIGLFSIVLTLCLGEIAASMPTSAGR
jgi:amino acid transporter